MKDSLLLAALVFAISYLALSLLVALIHHLTKNRDRSYRWGVIVFSLLLALYTYSSSLGRG